MRKSIKRARTRNKLREMRLKALIPSEAKLAKLSGICRTTICALENNRITLSVENALRLKRILGCSLDELYEEELSEGQESGAGCEVHRS
jgi:DNA-binding XRE family transcriptional regulator